MVWNNCWRSLTQNAIDLYLHNNTPSHTNTQTHTCTYHSLSQCTWCLLSFLMAFRVPLRILPKDMLYWCFFFSKNPERNPKGSGCDHQHWKGKVMHAFSNIPSSSWKIFMNVLFTPPSRDIELSSFVGTQHLFSLARKNTNDVQKERCLVHSGDT